MDQHLAHGYELDCRSHLPDACCSLLCACWHQGPAVPGQQDAWWTGRCTDDHLKRRLTWREHDERLDENGVDMGNDCECTTCFGIHTGAECEMDSAITAASWCRAMIESVCITGEKPGVIGRYLSQGLPEAEGIWSNLETRECDTIFSFLCCTFDSGILVTKY